MRLPIHVALNARLQIIHSLVVNLTVHDALHCTLQQCNISVIFREFFASVIFQCFSVFFCELNRVHVIFAVFLLCYILKHIVTV